MRLQSLWLVLLLVAGVSTAEAAEPVPLPTTADGWSIELLAQAPLIHAPTAVLETPAGLLFLAQDPMDLNGPATERVDYIVTLRRVNGQMVRTRFADNLGPVMGLEWTGDTLLVAHAPLLTALRDTDGDGRADQRIDLVRGLGPRNPAFNGYNDHVISGMRLGMDGFVYVPFGDKGIPAAVGSDGKTLRVRGGGVLRVRPDGTDLELVASGLRNPLSVAINRRGDTFAYGNDDDSKQWPNGLIHLIDGGHYGYPYEFLDAPQHALPLITGRIGGAGSQGFCFEEAGLAPQFQGNLFFADWGLQTLIRFEIESAGASYRLKRRSDVVQAGPLESFRPFCAAVGGDGNSILLVDWAIPSKLQTGIQRGRLYRLRYHGSDATGPPPAPAPEDVAQALSNLAHPARRTRLAAQRFLTGQDAGKPAVLRTLLQTATSAEARRHALWALDRGHETADPLLTKLINDPDSNLRAEALRVIGIRRYSLLAAPVAHCLTDQEPRVRREAAIALGRIGLADSVPALLAALDDSDPFVAWSVRRALERIQNWNTKQLVDQLLSRQGTARRSLVWLLERQWDERVVETWCQVANGASDEELRVIAYRCLADLYFRFPVWDGAWFGTNPLIGNRPIRSETWSLIAGRRIRETFVHNLQQRTDEERVAILELLPSIGSAAVDLALPWVDNTVSLPVRRAAIGVLVRFDRPPALQRLATCATTITEPLALRQLALTGLLANPSETATRGLQELVQRPTTPAVLLALAVPALAKREDLPEERLEQLLEHRNPEVLVAGLQAVNQLGNNNAQRWQTTVVEHLQHASQAVRQAAIETVRQHGYQQAIPELVKQFAIAELRTAVIDALATMPTAQAVEIYLAGLADQNPTRRRQCREALHALRNEVASDLRKRTDLPATVRAQVERVLLRLQPVTRWRTIGPFPREVTGDVFGQTSMDFSQSHPGADGTPVKWRWTAAEKTKGITTLTKYGTISNRAKQLGFDDNNNSRINVFAHTLLTAPAALRAVLSVGSSGSLRIWVNGQQVYRFRDWSGRLFAADEDLIPIRLEQGENELLVQSHVGIGTWQFNVQVSTPDQDINPQRLALSRSPLLRAYALANRGDAARGKQLFFNTGKVRCSRCHAVAGRGGQVGPDLAGFAAQFNRAETIDSILAPSRRLANGYISVILATDSGQVLTGLVRNESDVSLELVDGEGRAVRLATEEIEIRRPSQKSLMPDGLVDHLSDTEFSDLVEFVGSLRSRPPVVKSNR
ncbi:MAG: HEAT repeat domain-containing protein [Planctomycetota bacterium]|nr:HEAT repeat domain-containing protein [Planctomycetota bacterium]